MYAMNSFCGMNVEINMYKISDYLHIFLNFAFAILAINIITSF